MAALYDVGVVAYDQVQRGRLRVDRVGAGVGKRKGKKV